MKFYIFFILFFYCSYSFSQNNSNNRNVNDERVNNINNEIEKKIFLSKLNEKKQIENKQLMVAKTSQTAVEMCSNSGFELYETISGSQKLKNFLYTIGDPPGPTQCKSITNTANSHIDIYNPSNTSIMATTVPGNLIDPFLGNINAFDQYALKINYDNSSTYGSIVQGKRFKNNNENYLKFNFKAVLMTVYDTGHTDNQPFVKARIINSSGVVVSEFCLVGDEQNCIFTVIPDSSSPVLYTKNWQSGLLDISSIPNNEEFTVEFMASRCGFGGHFGYMYVDDICVLHSNENLQGSIELNPLNKVCSNLPINICGSYTIPNSGGITATLGTITLNLYNSSGISVYSTTTTSSLNTTTQQFCFNLNSSNFPNVLNANYNVGVSATYNVSGSSPCLGTTFEPAIDSDANPGWDISFQNCSTSCNFDLSTTKLSLCDNNHDGVEIFNLQNANSSIVGSTSGLTFNYFTTFNDANANTNSISNNTTYSSSSKTIYVRVSQSPSCFRIIAISLEVKNPNVNISGILNVCSGSTVLTASSGSSYLWNNGATTEQITVSSIGTYSVTVTDSNGCSNTASVIIEPTQTAAIPNVIITQPSCFVSTGSIQITSVGSQYSFDNGNTWSTNPIKNNLFPNTYQIKIKTINNCISYPLEVTINAALTSYPNYTSTNPAFCGDIGSITIITSASFYSFDDGVTWITNPIATNLPNGTYKIRTKDSQGCISNFNTVLITSLTLETPVLSVINPACGVNGSITVNTASDFYTFDGGSTWITSNILTNVTSGSYSIAIKNNLGCTSEYSNAYVNDLQNTYPETSIVQPICGTGGSIAITTLADFYSFDGGTTWSSINIATNLPADNYTIIVKNTSGCVSQTNYVTLYPPYLDQPIIEAVQPKCGINGIITINTLSNFYSFDGGITWVTSNTMSLQEGNYVIMIKNSLGCTSSGAYITLYPPRLPLPLATIIQPVCSNTGIITVNTPAAFYSIDGGSTWVTNSVFNNLGAGNYYICIKNSLGCISDYVNVGLNANFLEEPTFTYINPSCGNIGSITFTSTAAFYSIDGGASWSSNSIFSNLTSGSYSLFIKNNAGCISNQKYIYLSSSNLSIPNYTIIYPCNNNNGSITFTTTAAFYSIDDGTTWLTNPIFSNIASGYYYLRIKNSAGCISDYHYIFVNNYLPNPNITTVQPICGTNGSLTVTTPASFYSIDGGTTWVTNSVFSNLNPGYYNIMIKNSSGCTSYSQSVNLVQPLISAPNFTVLQPTCGVTGTITVTTSATQYSKDGGVTWQISPIFSNLTAGYYSITIKNNLGCISNSVYINIDTYYLPNPNITIVQPTCGNNGSITVATSSFQYSFDGGTTWTSNPVKSNLTTGYYNIMIKNNQGCISSPSTMSVIIHDYYLPTPLVTSIQPSCENNGNITVLTSADFYSFDNGATWTTNPIILNPATGSYFVKIKNNLGCTSEYQSIYISQYFLSNPNITTTQPTCTMPTGTINVTTPANQYSFDNGLTWVSNSTISNLASGSYQVKIKNSFGCESNSNYIYIYSPPNIPNAPSVTLLQPSSCGTTDGSLTVNTSASEYSFNNGTTWTTNPTKINLAAGTYYIKTRNNSSSCESTAAVVTLNSGITIAAPTFTVVNPGCSNQNGSITITTTASYYSFDDGITFITSNTKINLLPGVYKVKIKNAAGCISNFSTATIASSTNLPPPIYTVTQPDCSNTTGSITITTLVSLYSFDNGITYSSSNNQNGLTPGNYQIKIKDATGCVSNSILVIINSQPIIPNSPLISINQPLTCTVSTGIITVVSNGLLFSFDNGFTWSGNNNSAPLIAGTYQVVVKETTSGCTSSATTAIINAPPNTPSTPILVVTQPTTCSNPFGTIQITSLASQYSFNNGVTYSTNNSSGALSPGTYLVKVKNNDNCESFASQISINAPTDYPLAPTYTILQPDCTNALGKITITSSANSFSFDNGLTWNNNANSIFLIAGDYNLKIKNALGCISPISIATIIPFTNFTILPILANPQIFCIQNTNTINSIAITGQNIKWYDAQTLGNLLPNTTTLINGTTYYATQTINNCESLRVPITITIQNTTAPIANANQSFCATQNATLNEIIITGNNINWYSSSTSTVVLPSTTLLVDGSTYYATQTINNCESTSRLAIAVTLINTLNANNYNDYQCDDTDNKFELVDLTSYQSNLISNTNTCTFVFYTSNNGAMNQTVADKIITVSSYKLLVGNTTIYVRITSTNTCHQIVELQLTLYPKPQITIADITPICANQSITIDAGAGFDSYIWSTGEINQQSITVSEAGSLGVTVTKNNGLKICSATKNFEVVQSNIATIKNITIEDFTATENTISVNLTSGSIGDYEYSIDGISYQDSPTFYGLSSGLYTVYVKDKNNCGIINDEIYLLMYPQFFTPNADGYNDVWKIEFSEIEPNLDIKIFDRYGKYIKQLNGLSTGWNGTFNGTDLPADDYWFVITRPNNKEIRGHFALKR